jgi:chaperonin GroES
MTQLLLTTIKLGQNDSKSRIVVSLQVRQNDFARRKVVKIKPLGDRVLVKMVEAEAKTAGGILIPQTAQEKTQEGVVLAVGTDEEIKVKAKDRVIYDKYAGSTIKVEGEEQLILKMADILAVIE